jgi:hypothetical protein
MHFTHQMHALLTRLSAKLLQKKLPEVASHPDPIIESTDRLTQNMSKLKRSMWAAAAAEGKRSKLSVHAVCCMHDGPCQESMRFRRSDRQYVSPSPSPSPSCTLHTCKKLFRDSLVVMPRRLYAAASNNQTMHSFVTKERKLGPILAAKP